MRPTIRNSRTGSDADQSTKPNVVAGPNEVRPAGVATPDTPEDAPPSLSGGVGTQRFDRARLSASRAVSSSSLETGCLRCAWSCPLSSERFEVEPQGPEAEVAGLGVAVALRKLLSNWTDPVRRLSSLSLRRFLRIGPHVCVPPLLGRAGFLPCSTRGWRGSPQTVRPFLRSLSSRFRVVPGSGFLQRASFTSSSWCSCLDCSCPWPRLCWRMLWSAHPRHPPT